MYISYNHQKKLIKFIYPLILDNKSLIINYNNYRKIYPNSAVGSTIGIDF